MTYEEAMHTSEFINRGREPLADMARLCWASGNIYRLERQMNNRMPDYKPAFHKSLTEQLDHFQHMNNLVTSKLTEPLSQHPVTRSVRENKKT